MKKLIYCLLSLLVCVFLAGTAAAADLDDVTNLPLNKWGYKNVGGWGYMR